MTTGSESERDYGAVDIVVAPFTPLEVANGQIGVDEAFMDKVRMPAELRRGVELTDYVAMMDRARVECSLPVAVHAGDMRMKYSFAIPHERVAEYCERFPGRFDGLAGIDPSATMRGLRELEHAVSDSASSETPLPTLVRAAPGPRPLLPLLREVLRARHPDHDAGRPLPRLPAGPHPPVGRAADQSRPRSNRFPGAAADRHPPRRPWTEEMISVLSNTRTSTWRATPTRRSTGQGHSSTTRIARAGRKCLFGTDWPVISPERAIREVDELELPAPAKRKLLRDNALKLFRLPGG